MNKVLFFKNVRQDDGVHIGFVVNDEILFEDYRVDTVAPDPSLLWYIDLECECANIPAYPEPIRNWFLQLAPVFNRLLGKLCQKLEVGSDSDLVPFTLEETINQFSPEVLIRVRGSALCQIRATEIAGYLQQTMETWVEELKHLPAFSAALT